MKFVRMISILFLLCSHLSLSTEAFTQTLNETSICSSTLDYACDVVSSLKIPTSKKCEITDMGFTGNCSKEDYHVLHGEYINNLKKTYSNNAKSSKYDASSVGTHVRAAMAGLVGMGVSSSEARFQVKLVLRNNNCNPDGVDTITSDEIIYSSPIPTVVGSELASLSLGEKPVLYTCNAPERVLNERVFPYLADTQNTELLERAEHSMCEFFPSQQRDSSRWANLDRSGCQDIRDRIKERDNIRKSVTKSVCGDGGPLNSGGSQVLSEKEFRLTQLELQISKLRLKMATGAVNSHLYQNDLNKMEESRDKLKREVNSRPNASSQAPDGSSTSGGNSTSGSSPKADTSPSSVTTHSDKPDPPKSQSESNNDADVDTQKSTTEPDVKVEDVPTERPEKDDDEITNTNCNSVETRRRIETEVQVIIDGLMKDLRQCENSGVNPNISTPSRMSDEFKELKTCDIDGVVMGLNKLNPMTYFPRNNRLNRDPDIVREEIQQRLRKERFERTACKVSSCSWVNCDSPVELNERMPGKTSGQCHSIQDAKGVDPNSLIGQVSKKMDAFLSHERSENLYQNYLLTQNLPIGQAKIGKHNANIFDNPFGNVIDTIAKDQIIPYYDLRDNWIRISPTFSQERWIKNVDVAR